MLITFNKKQPAIQIVEQHHPITKKEVKTGYTKTTHSTVLSLDRLSWRSRRV